jgi:hypothetical protein
VRIMLCVYVLIISVRMTFSPPNIPIKQTFLTTFNNSVPIRYISINECLFFVVFFDYAHSIPLVQYYIWIEIGKKVHVYIAGYQYALYDVLITSYDVGKSTKKNSKFISLTNFFPAKTYHYQRHLKRTCFRSFLCLHR